jgi:hypothetical protein
MNKERNFTVINGNRVQIPDRRKNKNGDYEGLEPSYGYYEWVKAPWGAQELCYLVTVPSLAGEKEIYASVFKPKTNPGVRWSVFKVNA